MTTETLKDSMRLYPFLHQQFYVSNELMSAGYDTDRIL